MCRRIFRTRIFLHGEPLKGLKELEANANNNVVQCYSVTDPLTPINTPRSNSAVAIFFVMSLRMTIATEVIASVFALLQCYVSWITLLTHY